MAPIVNLYRLVMGGRLFSTEQWSCTLHVNSTPVQVGPLVTTGGVGKACIDLVQNPAAKFSPGTKLDFVKFNRIDPVTAKYADNGPTVEIQQLAMGTPDAGTAYPAQVACVATLRTFLTRGRGHAGRIYIPVEDVGVANTTGEISSVTADGIAVAVATFIGAVNTALPGGKVCVYSKVGQVANDVTSVDVGVIMDTMRSRRTSLLEKYENAAVNP